MDSVNGFGNAFAREMLNPDSPASAGGRIARDQGVFALPHVVTFSSIFSSAYRTYSWRWDEAYKTSTVDALSMRRDAFLMGILQERQLASSQLNWHIACENPKDKRQKRCAEFITNVIRRMRGLPTFLYNLQDAVWWGRCGLQIAWNWRKDIPKPSEIADHPGHRGEVLVPERYVPLNGDKIQYRYRLYDDGPEVEDGIPVVLVHSAWGSRLPRGETVLTDRGRGLLLRSPYWRERFVIHHHVPDDADFFEAEMAGGVYGVGVRSRIYWLDWIRKEWLANVSDYIQRVGQGTIILYYEAGNPQSEAQAIAVGNNIQNQTVVVWPRPIGSNEKQGAGIDIMNPPMSGSETLVRLMEHLEQIIERYIIGQTASSRIQNAGMGNGDITGQMDTKYRIIKFDAMNGADSLTNDLIQVLMRWNCPEEKYRLWFVYNTDDPNVAQRIDAAYKLYMMGLPIVEDPLLDITGLPKADKNDDVLWSIQGQQQLQAAKQMEQQEKQQATGLAQTTLPPGQPAAPEEAQPEQVAEQPAEQSAQPAESAPIPVPPSALPGGHGGPRSPELSAALGGPLGNPGQAEQQARKEQAEHFARKPAEWTPITTASGEPALKSSGGRIVHTPLARKPGEAPATERPRGEEGQASQLGRVPAEKDRPAGLEKTDMAVGGQPPTTPERTPNLRRPHGQPAAISGGTWHTLRSAPIRELKPNENRGVQESYIAHFEDGSKGVFKPHEFVRNEAYPVPENYAGREAVVAEDAHLLGLGHLVPETVIRADVNGMTGSMQRFVEGGTEGAKVPRDKRYDGPENLAQAALFDFLQMSGDRHSGNWLVTDDGKGLALIDNGYSIPENHTPVSGPAYDAKDAELLRMGVINGEVRHVIASRIGHTSMLLEKAGNEKLPMPDVSAWRDKWPAIQESMVRNGLDDHSIALKRKRFDFILQAADQGVSTIADLWKLARHVGMGGVHMRSLNKTASLTPAQSHPAGAGGTADSRAGATEAQP